MVQSVEVSQYLIGCVCWLNFLVTCCLDNKDNFLGKVIHLELRMLITGTQW